MGAHVPRRRCVGCGRTAPKPELIRIALTDQRSASPEGGARRVVVLDRGGTMPGRGAYLCHGVGADAPAADCLALAVQRGGISRTLRCAVTVPAELVESVSQ